jgi:general secretion pathway protein G
MIKEIRAARENESGFTLIELLIVIVILGVLAGIVVFAVSAFNNDGVAAACKSDVKNVEIASEAYFAKKSTRATAIDGAAGTTTLVGAGYLKEAPSSTKYTVVYDAATGNASSTTCP